MQWDNLYFSFVPSAWLPSFLRRYVSLRQRLHVCHHRKYFTLGFSIKWAKFLRTRDTYNNETASYMFFMDELFCAASHLVLVLYEIKCSCHSCNFAMLTAIQALNWSIGNKHTNRSIHTVPHLNGQRPFLNLNHPCSCSPFILLLRWRHH